MPTPAPTPDSPPDRKRRRRITRISLASAIVVALGASGTYIAGANANDKAVAVPGQVRAESAAAQSGTQLEGTADQGGGQNAGWIGDADFLRFDNITSTGTQWSARVASNNKDGGTLEVHTGSVNGALLATYPIAYTGGWQTWKTLTVTAAKAPTGPQTLFVVAHTKSPDDFVNLNWLTFGPAAASSGAPSSPSSSPASSSAAPSAPAGGWVPVDQAAYRQQLALLDAYQAPKPTPEATNVPEFQVNCTVANEDKVDPIVLPGLPGASHKHTFMGPVIDENTTAKDLLARQKTTCDTKGDFSAYWFPQLQKDGKAVPLKNFRVYYGSRVSDPSKVKPFPNGLQMVEGNAKLQEPTPKGKGNQFWCAGSAEIGRSADGNWPVCAPGGNLIFQLVFKDCWDGKHLDAPDHKAHMGDPVGGECRGDYPVAVPSLSFMINYDSLGGDGLQLSSGLPSSEHGDTIQAWDPEKIAAMVKTCLNQHAKCGTEPVFVGG